MSKRKVQEANGIPPKQDTMGDDSGSEDDIDMIDVDFEWFAPAQHDFHGLKALLRQLLDADNDLLDLSGLADLILSQPQLGSTVKCDGEDSDPYAFLTILNLTANATNPAVRSLISYLSSRTKTNTSLAQLSDLLSNPDAQIGLILTERLINMPTEIVPPLYTMLMDELSTAGNSFTHYLILSKTYMEVVSELETADRPKKKVRQGASGGEEVFYFHAEDEVLQRHAACAGGWDYEKVSEGGADSKRAFQEEGIQARGHGILIEGARFEGAVKAVGEYLGAAS
ncbi:hypothetical protein CAC42_4413 [Sphaceloma murrayae]|uniref:Protein BCP1 n=1 Tax=Sphaceloma murrayae TaxID=2082308 RepID=A0A2K1QM39_9PEZI|nr:hypothetical protein CAC42_4413 [Sphaceloma murrayae]